MTKLFRDKLAGNLSAEDINSLFSAAERKGATLTDKYDSLNFGQGVDRAKRDAYAYQQQIYSLNVEDKLGGLFRGQDLTKALTDPNAIQEVLQRGNLTDKEKQYFSGLQKQLSTQGSLSYQEAVEYLSPMLGDSASLRKTADMADTQDTSMQKDVLAGFRDIGMDRLPSTLDRVATSLDRVSAIGIQQIAMTEKLATTLAR